ncbi:hypothetical protein MMC20_004012 [Loxospora ochrophaea]|nr:hypothetical protein [Loxospora ochrophaea]
MPNKVDRNSDVNHMAKLYEDKIRETWHVDPIYAIPASVRPPIPLGRLGVRMLQYIAQLANHRKDLSEAQHLMKQQQQYRLETNRRRRTHHLTITDFKEICRGIKAADTEKARTEKAGQRRKSRNNAERSMKRRKVVAVKKPRYVRDGMHSQANDSLDLNEMNDILTYSITESVDVLSIPESHASGTEPPFDTDNEVSDTASSSMSSFSLAEIQKWVRDNDYHMARSNNDQVLSLQNKGSRRHVYDESFQTGDLPTGPESESTPSAGSNDSLIASLPFDFGAIGSRTEDSKPWWQDLGLNSGVEEGHDESTSEAEDGFVDTHRECSGAGPITGLFTQTEVNRVSYASPYARPESDISDQSSYGSADALFENQPVQSDMPRSIVGEAKYNYGSPNRDGLNDSLNDELPTWTTYNVTRNSIPSEGSHETQACAHLGVPTDPASFYEAFFPGQLPLNARYTSYNYSDLASHGNNFSSQYPLFYPPLFDSLSSDSIADAENLANSDYSMPPQPELEQLGISMRHSSTFPLYRTTVPFPYNGASGVNEDDNEDPCMSEERDRNSRETNKRIDRTDLMVYEPWYNHDEDSSQLSDSNLNSDGRFARFYADFVNDEIAT